jgi:Kef-type K+ transport system membrane component KefB
MSSFFVELSLVMLIALLMSFIFHKLKQPLLVGYIFTGILAGPLFFDILSSTEGYQTFSHIGVALLLFIVGLHLNLKLIKEIGFVAAIAGCAQIILTALLGSGIAYLFGLDLLVSLLIGIGLAFSSTIVIVKLLSDKREIERVHGKIAMGILIIQDLVAVVVLMVLASISSSSGESLAIGILKTFGLGVVAIAGVLIFSKFVLERLMDWVADSQEFLFTFVIAWCLGVAALFAYLGFSVEVGALLAGVALASSPYQYEVSSRIKPLRDFFIIMFFISLGSQMVPVDNIPNVVSYIDSDTGVLSTFFSNYLSKISYLFDSFSKIFIPALVLSLFVIVIKPVLVFIVLNLLGFHSRVAFKTSFSLAQISEFSLIMILIARGFGLVSAADVSLLTLVGIITILCSTYFIMHSEKLYDKLKGIFKILELRQ